MKKYLLFFASIILIPVGGVVAVKVYNATRGLRNNNPFNIRKTTDQWQGLSETQTDSAFFQFVSPVYGIRAGMKLLTNYYTRYGLNTIRGIISRFAPSSENDTESYIKSVSQYMGANPDSIIDVKNSLVILSKAIVRHENGIQPYDESIYKTALTLI